MGKVLDVSSRVPEPKSCAPDPGTALTDLGNAERLVMKHGENIRYVADWNKWLIWDGFRWALDRTGEIKKIAGETVRSIYEESARIPEYDKRKACNDWARKSEERARIEAMISLAKANRAVSIVPEILDADPWLLAVENGTLDLQSGRLWVSDRSKYITKKAGAAFDPRAKCPVFLEFLEKVFLGDRDLITFMQRALGYSLTGIIRERCFFLLWGVGRNGKSTLLEVFQSLLSEYSLRTPTDTLMFSYRSGGVPNDIARLRGARFVSACESEEGQRLAESRIKDLTGGDTISARFMRGEFFDFRPEFKLWMATNHKPTIRGMDDAIWDRIRLVPFEYRVPDMEVDPSLPDRLKNELSGILNWALQGCLDWQRNGLGMPEKVLQSCINYRTEQDEILNFMADCCVSDPENMVSSQVLYKKYVSWCRNGGQNPVSQKRFSLQVQSHGYSKKRDMHGYKWIDIRILDDKSDDSQK